MQAEGVAWVDALPIDCIGTAIEFYSGFLYEQKKYCVGDFVRLFEEREADRDEEGTAQGTLNGKKQIVVYGEIRKALQNEDREKLVELRLYYRPEDTCLGRQPIHAVDELIASTKQPVWPCEKLVSMLAHDPRELQLVGFDEYCRIKACMKRMGLDIHAAGDPEVLFVRSGVDDDE